MRFGQLSGGLFNELDRTGALAYHMVTQQPAAHARDNQPLDLSDPFSTEEHWWADQTELYTLFL